MSEFIEPEVWAMMGIALAGSITWVAGCWVIGWAIRESEREIQEELKNQK
jgi:uncharacterized protein YdgA (DUF945 family)